MSETCVTVPFCLDEHVKKKKKKILLYVIDNCLLTFF